MIITLSETTTSLINRELVRTRQESGVVTLGRVMTLIIDASPEEAEEAIEAANAASREHPCRIIVLVPSKKKAQRLDAEIRVGGDAGAAEVIVLRPAGEMTKHADTLVIPLLLPDAPIVAWWPGDVPKDPARSASGAMAARRITDSRDDPDVTVTLRAQADAYRPGDTDLAWARVTLWRALLAAALDQVPDAKVTKARLHGDPRSPSILLMGAWLKSRLGCAFEASYDEKVEGLQSVALETAAGDISITRVDDARAALHQPGQPDQVIAMPRRSLTDCLTEDLRRLDEDEVYGETLAALSRGLEK